MAQQPGAVLKALPPSLGRRIPASSHEVDRAKEAQDRRGNCADGDGQLSDITQCSWREHVFLLDGRMGITGRQYCAGLGHHRRRAGRLLPSPWLPPEGRLGISSSSGFEQLDDGTAHRCGDDLGCESLTVQLGMIGAGDDDPPATCAWHDDDDSRLDHG